MKKRKVFLKTIMTIITTVCLLTLTGCASQTIDFEQLVKVEFYGLNGKGTVSADINRDISGSKAFLEDIYPDYSERKASQKLENLTDSFEYSFSEEEGLSNGDEVTVTVNYDKDKFKKDEIEVKNTKFKVIVDGLSLGTTIDVFDGLEVTYSGLSGKGYAVFDNSSCDSFTKDYVYFECDQTDLSNGDTITVKANYSQESADNNLVIVETDTKEFTVNGLKEPVEIDPFEKLGITYTGASPYITASIDSSKCDSIVNQYIQFNLEEKYLRNGDTLTVTAVYNEYDAEEYGFVVTNDTKTFTVENQPEYVTSLDGLDLSALQSELNDKLTVFTTANENDTTFADVYLNEYFTSIASKSLKSQYLVSLKTSFEDKFDGYNYNYNRYTQIYEYTLNTKSEQKKVYVAVYVNNICKNSDGTISWDIELDSLGDKDYNVLVNKFATSEKEFYNVSEVKAQEKAE